MSRNFPECGEAVYSELMEQREYIPQIGSRRAFGDSRPDTPGAIAEDMFDTVLHEKIGLPRVNSFDILDPSFRSNCVVYARANPRQDNEGKWDYAFFVPKGFSVNGVTAARDSVVFVDVTLRSPASKEYERKRDRANKLDIWIYRFQPPSKRDNKSPLELASLGSEEYIGWISKDIEYILTGHISELNSKKH